MDNLKDCTGVFMIKLFTDSKLKKETAKYIGTGGVSQGNIDYGFVPAFMDKTQGDIFLSRHSDGKLAQVHRLDGLPDHLIISKQDGCVSAVKNTVISGFVLNEIFFTRAEAAQFVSENNSKSA